MSVKSLQENEPVLVVTHEACATMPSACAASDATPSALRDKSLCNYQEVNKTYWANRASSYSLQHQGELAGTQHAAWAQELDQHLLPYAANNDRSTLRVLDIGCGPGFFSILLAELGYSLTAIDYTASMLKQAKENALRCSQAITFQQMDAENLEFENASFDAIVSRNLTWNLPHPSNAYHEWNRVLRPGGVLLNYDANWYGHLYDNQMRHGYEADRANTAKAGCADRYLHTDIDTMERLAKEVPLSAITRPQWDKLILEEFGFAVTIDTRVSDRVWSPEEHVNQASTPLFRIKATKPL